MAPKGLLKHNLNPMNLLYRELQVRVVTPEHPGATGAVVGGLFAFGILSGTF